MTESVEGWFRDRGLWDSEYDHTKTIRLGPLYLKIKWSDRRGRKK